MAAIDKAFWKIKDKKTKKNARWVYSSWIILLQFDEFASYLI